jgi:glutamyl-tRNA synthetase/nondiscriminating glutamyl-tRNA synthetase
LHVGNVRTALVNWLVARQKNGIMVLRIEDTDVERSESRYEGMLMEDLTWLGLDWDEGPDKGGQYGPYRQSDRLDIYREHAERLLNEGKAYLCFCTEEELQKEREAALAVQGQAIYSGKCRKIEPEEAKKRRANGEAGAVRLKIPEHPIRFHDIVHGDVEFSNEVVSDPIIMRSSGIPVYNYVVVIDDALMKITHVIRGDDHLSNTPKQVALYEALGWPVPEFAHLSTILGSDRERLSKRHGATSIANFREMGVLPEALMNYLVLLGWAPSGGTREIFTPKELIKEFALKRVTPSPAVFDMEKLYWLNRHYIAARLKSDADSLINLTAPFLRSSGLLSPEVADQKVADAKLVEEREFAKDVLNAFVASVNTLEELPRKALPILHFDPVVALANPENIEVMQWPQSNAVINRFTSKILEDESARSAQMSASRFNDIIKEVNAETGAKGKELFHPIRIVVAGSHSGPAFDKLVPVFERGSRLKLPAHVASVRERVEAFMRARAK